MRIISGIAKGKRILSPSDKKTRPLKDLVKESIFNILRHSDLLNQKFTECLVLDLFSGVGSFGLEAISRGVRKVVFFENYKKAADMLKKNLSILDFNEQAEVNEKNVYDENSFENLKYKFDIIFLDPPFNDYDIHRLISNLADAQVLSSKNLTIIHRRKSTKDKFNDRFKSIREEFYGSSKIIFGSINT